MSVKLNLLLVLILIPFSVAYGQENVTDLKDKRVTLKMNKQPLGKVFRELMLKYDVAIGFEESILDREHNDYEI